MYDGHDMSSQEVVVRSLLEVLQDFDEASEGDRTVRAHYLMSRRTIELPARCRCFRSSCFRRDKGVAASQRALVVALWCACRPSDCSQGNSCGCIVPCSM